jgi:feruloyl esterase
MGLRLPIAILSGGVLGAALSVSAQTATTCDTKSIQAAAPSDTTIVSAQRVDKPVPNCKVDGYVTTTNPGPNRNNFRLQLPDKAQWQGRYYFIGMGGSAGYVPSDSQIPSGNPVVKGFAVAGTDTGHQGHLLDWSFLSDPVKTLDHVHRGAHVVAVATQQITKAYYDTNKLYRYHSGCSGGGRMGMEAIQKHPEDFDGVLLGYPSGRWPEGKPAAPRLGSAFDVMVQEMTREPGSWLSPAKLKFAEDKVTAACDEADGAKDGMIWDHRLCKFKFETLQCKAGDRPDCLTQPEITSINNLLAKTSMPISNMTVWSGFIGPVPPPWSPEASAENMPKSAAALVIETTWARTFLKQPDRDIVKNPLTTVELANIRDVGAEIGFNVPPDPDLRSFEKTGHKALFWVGVSDPCCSNLANENYFHDMAKVMGGADRVAKFATLYEVPGAGHCGGGAGPNDHADQLLQTLIDWVEQGKTPAAVVTHRGDRAKLAFNADNEMARTSGVKIPTPAGSARDFLLCPFPQVSVFDKSKRNVPGAVDDAANWSCRSSRS